MRIKTLLKAAACVLGAVAAALAGAAFYVHASGIPRYPVEKVELKVEVTPDRAARGRRNVSLLCANCHLDPVRRVLSGRPMYDLPAQFGTAWVPNITAHPVRGIGAWTDGEIAHLLRTGIRRDGQYVPPWMPKLVHMSDDDMKDIIAFLRSDDPWVKATDVAKGETRPSFLTKVLCRVAFKPFPYPRQPIEAPPLSDKVAYGRYLVTGKLECYTCHSADFKTVDYYDPERSKGYLGGGNPMPDLGGKTVYTANITFDPETGIGRWTGEQFRLAMKTGILPDRRPMRYPMVPQPELTDDEIEAMYAYLQSAPVIRNAVTRPRDEKAEAGPPGRAIYYKYGCNTCHGDTGVGQYDLRKGPGEYPNDHQLVAYIRDASRFKPGVKMPTWNEVIAEEEYAPLVEYVKTLAAGS